MASDIRAATTRGLGVATLVEIVVVEVLFTGNPWLTSVPLLFVGIPLAVEAAVTVLTIGGR